MFQIHRLDIILCYLLLLLNIKIIINGLYLDISHNLPNKVNHIHIFLHLIYYSNHIIKHTNLLILILVGINALHTNKNQVTTTKTSITKKPSTTNKNRIPHVLTPVQV